MDNMLPWEFEVSDEDNRKWHIQNIQAETEYLEVVTKEYEEKLAEAVTALHTAIEWAKQDYPEEFKDFD